MGCGRMKKESIGSWDITFEKMPDGTVIAFGYFGGIGSVSPKKIGGGSTKAEALKQARKNIKHYEEELKGKPQPYYQYRKNFGVW